MTIAYINGVASSQGYLKGKSRGGTVLMGGAADTTGPISNVPNLTVLGVGRKANPIAPAVAGRTKKAVTAGTYSVLTVGKYVMMGGNVTNTLAGVAYTGLAGGASGGYAQSIHYTHSRNTTKLTVFTLDFNYSAANVYPRITATRTSSSDEFAGVAGVTVTIGNSNAPTTTNAGDTAATPTRALPGLIVYQVGTRVPVIHEYDAKTG